MRAAKVFYNEQLAGFLIQHHRQKYEFAYTEEWFTNPDLPPVSLTLPKTRRTHQTDHLFPFFFNLLSEGVNKQLQCRQLKIDENDYFSLLLATATHDTIGAITVQPVDNNEHA